MSSRGARTFRAAQRARPRISMKTSEAKLANPHRKRPLATFEALLSRQSSQVRD
jgi:hypothetical protein